MKLYSLLTILILSIFCSCSKESSVPIAPNVYVETSRYPPVNEIENVTTERRGICDPNCCYVELNQNLTQFFGLQNGLQPHFDFAFCDPNYEVWLTIKYLNSNNNFETVYYSEFSNLPTAPCEDPSGASVGTGLTASGTYSILLEVFTNVYIQCPNLGGSGNVYCPEICASDNTYLHF